MRKFLLSTVAILALAAPALAAEFGPAKVDAIHDGNQKRCFRAGGVWFYAPGRDADVIAARVSRLSVTFDYDPDTMVPCHGNKDFAYLITGDFDY